jgi:hypothetical protein
MAPWIIGKAEQVSATVAVSEIGSICRTVFAELPAACADIPEISVRNIGTLRIIHSPTRASRTSGDEPRLVVRTLPECASRRPRLEDSALILDVTLLRTPKSRMSARTAGCIAVGLRQPEVTPTELVARHAYWAIRLFCATCTRLSVQNVQPEP